MSQPASRNKYNCGQYLDLCAEPHQGPPLTPDQKRDAYGKFATPPAENNCRPRSRFAACATGPAK